MPRRPLGEHDPLCALHECLDLGVAVVFSLILAGCHRKRSVPTIVFQGSSQVGQQICKSPSEILILVKFWTHKIEVQGVFECCKGLERSQHLPYLFFLFLGDFLACVIVENSLFLGLVKRFHVLWSISLLC